MDLKITSANNFQGKITTDIILRNANEAKRLENIIREYARVTADAPKNNIHLSQGFNPEADVTLLKIQGKDNFYTNNLIQDYMSTMSDSEIALKLAKIAEYLKLKSQKFKIFLSCVNKICDLENQIQFNERKAKALLQVGKEKFGKQFKKVAELNRKTQDKIIEQRDSMLNEIDSKIKSLADGDKDILEDMQII